MLTSRLAPEAVLEALGMAAGRRGRELTGDCPACGKVGHFGMNASTGRWNCFVCKARGGLRELVAAARRVDVDSASSWLRKMARRMPLRTPDEASRRMASLLDREAPPSEVRIPREALPPLDPVARRYLRGRGVSRALAERFGVSYCRVGSYAGRVIVPIPGPGGGLPFSFAARTVREDVEPPYLYPTGPKVSETLLWRPGGRAVVLVEGVFDAIVWAGKGVPAVAVFGSTLHEAQAALVVARWPRVTIAFDGDEPGREGARKAAALLAGLVDDLRVASLPDGEDPAACDPSILSTAKRIVRRPLSRKKNP